MTPTRLRPAAVAVTIVSALMAVGCGEPTAQVVQLPDSRFSYELPVEFTDIGVAAGDDPGRVYGLPETTLEELGGEPVFVVTTTPSGEVASFKSLRMLATAGVFDPVDESVPLPDDTELLGYVEYGEPDVWGIRMRLVIGRGAFDFQALVDRQSDQVVVTELICTQACLVEHLDLIDEIQASWSLKPGAVT